MKILLVNPSSSQEYLSDKFKSANIECVALYITDRDEIDPYSAPSSELFDKQIFVASSMSKNIETVLAQLNGYAFDYVINGTEEATHITDQIATKLIPQYANSPSTSNLRVNKFDMQESLRQAGFSNISQLMINLSEMDAVALQKQVNSYPVFCKPNDGCGSRGAFAAFSHSELNKKLNDARENGFEKSDYLIQEMLTGVEYVVDVFSAKGQHAISSIIRYHKILEDGVPVYRYAELETDPAIWEKCANFACNYVLPALDVQNGFSHNEFMITDSGEIKLIELNNRISGAKGMCNKMAALCNLIPQDALLINYLKSGELRSSQIAHRTGFSRTLILFKLDNTPLRDPTTGLAEFKSVKEVIMLKEVGESNLIADKFNGIYSACCIVILHSNYYSELVGECDQIFELEKRRILL